MKYGIKYIIMTVEYSVANTTFSHTFEAHASGPTSPAELVKSIQQLVGDPNLLSIHPPNQKLSFGKTVVSKTFSDNPDTHSQQGY